MNIISKILRYLKRRRLIVKNVLAVLLVLLFFISLGSMFKYKSKYDSQITQIEKEKLMNESLSKQVHGYEQQLHSYKLYVEDLEQQVTALEQKVDDLLIELANNTQYPDPNYIQASATWSYLKGIGLNDYVCAGIIGNMMSEVGGQTLDLSEYSTKECSGYYGICQWGGSRKDRLLSEYGSSFEDQLNFLSVELFEVIPEDHSFYQLTDEKEAALYFAKYYERCHSDYYTVRQHNATKALNHFTKMEL